MGRGREAWLASTVPRAWQNSSLCLRQYGWRVFLCAPAFLLRPCSLEASDPISGTLAPVLVTWKSFCSEDSLYDWLV